METYKVISMYADKKDSSLGISYISKGAFKKMNRKNPTFVGAVERTEKIDKAGNPIQNPSEVIGELEVAGRNVKVYKTNPQKFIGYIQIDNNSFLKIMK